MPISTALFMACMTALRLLCFAIAVLFLLLALRAQFDAEVAMPWTQSILGAAMFLLAGVAAGLLRKALARRTGH